MGLRRQPCLTLLWSQTLRVSSAHRRLSVNICKRDHGVGSRLLVALFVCSYIRQLSSLPLVCNWAAPSGSTVHRSSFANGFTQMVQV